MWTRWRWRLSRLRHFYAANVALNVSIDWITAGFPVHRWLSPRFGLEKNVFSDLANRPNRMDSSMTTMRPQLCFNAKNVLCLYLLFLTTGCAVPKQTWQEWMEIDEPSQAVLRAEPDAWTEPHLETLVLEDGYEMGDAARAGEGFNLEMRNPDFPETHIDRVYVDVTDPEHTIWISWTGLAADLGPQGPWRSNPGRGMPEFDCEDFDGSNTVDSWCTPKGLFPVAGFADHLEGVTSCHYVTWVQHAPRFIGLHSHNFIPTWADSHGCVRVPYDVSQLIHNNSLVGTTMISIDGTWTRPNVRGEE